MCLQEVELDKLFSLFSKKNVSAFLMLRGMFKSKFDFLENLKSKVRG